MFSCITSQYKFIAIICTNIWIHIMAVHSRQLYVTLLYSNHSMNRIHPSPYSYGCLGVESTFRRQQMNAWWHHQMEAFSALLAFVWGIHRSPVNFPHKGQWRGTLVFSLICAWTNDWVNNRKAGDLRRHHAHYDVTVMAHVSSTGKLHDSLSSVWPLSLHVYWNRDKYMYIETETNGRHFPEEI